MEWNSLQPKDTNETDVFIIDEETSLVKETDADSQNGNTEQVTENTEINSIFKGSLPPIISILIAVIAILCILPWILVAFFYFKKRN